MVQSKLTQTQTNIEIDKDIQQKVLHYQAKKKKSAKITVNCLDYAKKDMQVLETNTFLLLKT